MGFYPRPLQYIADPPRYVVAVLIFKKVSGMIVGSCLHVDPIPHCINWFSSSPTPPPSLGILYFFPTIWKFCSICFFFLESGWGVGPQGPQRCPRALQTAPVVHCLKNLRLESPTGARVVPQLGSFPEKKIYKFSSLFFLPLYSIGRNVRKSIIISLHKNGFF